MAHLNNTTTTVRFALAILALLALGGSISTATAAHARINDIGFVAKPGEALDPAGIYGAGPEFTVVIEAAIDRFDTAGLTLPELRIYAHNNRDGCLGMDGLFNRDGTGTRVDLCTQVNYTLLHELAHAWEYHTMDDVTRHAYVEHTGLPTWADPESDWEDRGIEAAATAIAWGLLDIPIANTERFTDELYEFELLTGRTSPRLTTGEQRS
ncbi:MAG: hypothetical protein QNJ77_04220 [Acidimicrobiia bacterium]|nr:hypothetical protein [Acidimicrobiia bacterium]